MSVSVLAITTGLGTGGAERMLCQIATRAARHGVRMRVVSLGPDGPFAREIAESGVPVDVLGIRSPAHGALRTARLAAIVRNFRPAVVQGWMYHGNLAALGASLIAPGGSKVSWAIRQSLADFDLAPRLTRLAIRAGARFSRATEAIVYNAACSAREHEAIGYHTGARHVVPNGFDIERFRPDPDAATRLRRELGAQADDVLVGYVARRHPIKDHHTWLRAVAGVARRRHAVRAVLVGAGTDDADLASEAARLGLGGRFHGLGERHGLDRVVPGFDISTSSSLGEGLPNAIGEALACAVPCVATDVGATRDLIGEAGVLVPPADPEALAVAIEHLVTAGPEARKRMGAIGRERIVASYRIDGIVARFAELWSRMARR